MRIKIKENSMQPQEPKTPVVKGVRTGIQAIIGSVVGLVLVVWAVPGVPEVVVNYLQNNWLPLLLLVGVPSGLVAWLQNRLGK
jgi:hypothetical protein